MKKSSFVAMVLGTVSVVLFALVNSKIRITKLVQITITNNGNI